MCMKMSNPVVNWNTLSGVVVILLVTSYWVACGGCDGLALHSGGSSNAPSYFMLGNISCGGLASHLGGSSLILRQSRSLAAR